MNDPLTSQRPQSRCLHVTCAINKGGTGKTTTAVHLAAGLAVKGLRVLLADLDRQGQCSSWFGQAAQPGVYRWLALGEPLEKVAWICPALGEHAYILPSNHDTQTVDVNRQTQGIPAGDLALRFAADPMAQRFDVVIWDTAAYGHLTDSALCMADILVVPVAPDYMALEGLRDILAQQEGLRAANSLPLSQEKMRRVILPTRVDHTRLTRENMALLNQYYAHLLAPEPIPERVALREAAAQATTVFTSRPNDDSAHAYLALAEHVYALAAQAQNDLGVTVSS